MREWRRKNPERARAKSRRYWAVMDPEKRRKAMRRSNLMRGYGITVDEFDRLGEQQGWKCAICSCGIDGTRKFGRAERRNACVDHHHGTQRVRGLLCWGCNTGIGQLGDDVGRLLAAVDYLRRHSKPEDGACGVVA